MNIAAWIVGRRSPAGRPGPFGDGAGERRFGLVVRLEPYRAQAGLGAGQAYQRAEGPAVGSGEQGVPVGEFGVEDLVEGLPRTPAPKSLTVMYRKQGIRANVIASGGTRTGIVVDAAPDAHGPAAVGPHFVNLGRPARPEEQTAALVFLASDAASNNNGVILPVDEGWSAV